MCEGDGVEVADAGNAKMKYLHAKVGSYKCFSEEAQGFSSFGDVNLIIGRNNSGKSRLLDLVRYLCNPSSGTFNAPTYVEYLAELEENDLRSQFNEKRSGGDISGNHWHDAGVRFIWRKISAKTLGNNVISSDVEGGFSNQLATRFEVIALSMRGPLAGRSFVHIAAERSISPEKASGDSI